MSSSKEFSVRGAEGGLLILGPRLDRTTEDGEPAWSVLPLDRDRVLLQSKNSQKGMAGFKEGMAKCTVELFIDFLCGLHQRHFSGVVSVDTGRGVKKLYFHDGSINFAASNLIDDRLGEVIYRAGMITLEQMAESAVKVNRSTKFGKVLLNSRIFTTVDLWTALKLQVAEIVRSVFLVNGVYFQIEKGAGLAPTSVVYAQGTQTLIEESASFGSMFRAFLLRITENSAISVNNESIDWVEPTPGTFDADILDLVRETGTVNELVAKSKLKDINTYVALFQLVNRRLVNVESLPEDPGVTAIADQLGDVKAKLDAYDVLLRGAKKAFDEAEISFPIIDMKQFVASLNPPIMVVLFLADDGTIPRECVLNIYSHCRDSEARKAFIIFQLQSLIRFLLQVTGDLLPSEVGWKVKKSFEGLVT